MPTDYEMMSIACTTMRHYLDKAYERYGRQFKMPSINFNLRGRTAGKAFYYDNEVRLNLVLFRENVEGFKARTIPHELAHLITHVLYPNAKPHGREWKSVMRSLGGPTTRCHSFDTSNSEVRSVRRRFTVRCDCRTYQFTSIRYNRMRSGERSYSCRQCGGRVRI
jgi:SprT protein